MDFLDTAKEKLADLMPQLGDILGQIFISISDTFKYLFSWLTSRDLTMGELYSGLIRYVMPILALHILLTVLRRMMAVKNPGEIWGYLINESTGKYPLKHWECTVGRARHCDIQIKLATISRTQCAITRDRDGSWMIQDLGGHGTTLVNGSQAAGHNSDNGGWISLIKDFRSKPLQTIKEIIRPSDKSYESTPLKHGDKISIGGLEFTFESITKQEFEVQQKKRRLKATALPPWTSFVTLTVFQVLTLIEFLITRPDNRIQILAGFGILMAVMWAYVFFTYAMGQRGFEPELLAFFACTLNIAVSATSSPGIIIKQALAIAIGVIGFLMLGWYLRDLKRVNRTRHLMALATVMLFVINILLGRFMYGARNWISVFGVSLQPSEIAKICFIFAGAATLDRLFVKRNLFGFMLLSGFCLLALAITGDFGTAAIFFVVFLVISFMRSGDFATLSLICGACVSAIGLILRFKPYIANRFSVWGHVWDDPSNMGYQQVRTMSASASGGLIGVGGGNGWLKNIAASNTDLVLGIICEEWGLIIALLSVSIIVVLSIFAFRVTRAGRSAYYTIAACAATSLFVFQTMLNVFGSVDILPLTGVTFPFISCGGSSMIASWGLLAYLKAADTRQNASFAVAKKADLGDVPDDPLALSESRLMERYKQSQEAKADDDDFAIFDSLQNMNDNHSDNNVDADDNQDYEIHDINDLFNDDDWG